MIWTAHVEATAGEAYALAGAEQTVERTVDLAELGTESCEAPAPRMTMSKATGYGGHTDRQLRSLVVSLVSDTVRRYCVAFARVNLAESVG